MYLKKLSLINFKNIREENLEFRPGINCFVGDNGAGKTNVIDAVYFLSMCKSSLAMTDLPAPVFGPHTPVCPAKQTYFSCSFLHRAD